MTRVQLKRVNYNDGDIHRIDDVVEMEANQAAYALGMGDVIASAAAVSTPIPPPVRIDNRPGARVSRAQELLKNGASGIALSANDNTFFTRNGAIELLQTLEAAFGNVRTSPATRRDPDTGLLSWGPHNYAPWSQDFDNAAWTKTGGGTGSTTVVTPNAVIAPDGTLTADKLDFNLNGGTTANDQSHISFNTAPLNLIGLLATNSVWLRADVPVTVALRTPANNGTYILCNVTTEWKRFHTSVLMTQAGIVYQIGLRGTFTTANTASVYAWGASVILGDLQNYVPNFTSSPTFRLRRHLSPKTGKISALVEETRTNSFSNSQDLSIGWTPSASVLTANQAIGPTGANDLWKLVNDATAGLHGISIANPALNVATSWSIFARAGTLAYVRVGNDTDSANAVFNLTNGTVFSISNATATVEDWGGGLYRCTVHYSTTGGGNRTMRVLISEDGTTFNYTGTGKHAFIGYFQHEAGACASSHIFTSGGTVQRTADNPSLPISSVPYNPVEGTMYAQFAKHWPSVGTVGNIVTFQNGNFIERLYSYVLNRGWNVRDTADQCDMPINPTDVGILYKIAGSYKLNDFDFASGGALAAPDNLGTVGDATGGNFTLGGNSPVLEITEVATYTTKLPDAQLQALTG